jgi:transposase
VRAAGGRRVCHRVTRAIHAAAGHPGGIAAERDAALERAAFAFHDWITALAAIAEVEARMVAVLDELHLTHLVAAIPGLYAVSEAAILAEAGDPHRYDTARLGAPPAPNPS